MYTRILVYLLAITGFITVMMTDLLVGGMITLALVASFFIDRKE